MPGTIPAFTPLQATLWLTLCAKALDNRLSDPILGDATADKIVWSTGYAYRRLHLTPSTVVTIAHRAKKLDEVVQRFMTRHPDAVGLDLGAGLDSRVLRVAPPSGADWYDIDFPEVITARRLLLPEHATPNGIGADLDATDWLDALPRDRPAVIVADGLLAFRSARETVSLMRRLVDHFPSGEIAFNGYSRFAMWVLRHARIADALRDVTRFPGLDDPGIVERWHPRLRLDREILCGREPEVARFPPGPRLMTRLTAPSATLSRMISTVYVYRF
ncbi:class I SAM-dependent methyltransferase [Nonomuraea longicatena]|uniref:Class I SAM-dependent methyltransferase n=1 Tax=Nonomuraea longicatena TaxID=83682 RepID=A0ABN1PN25_9ACTN